MRFIDVGQEAHGVFAFGQIATGFVAVGQVATGVIAIGQVARGGIAIGQVSFGLWAVGMGSAGLFWSAAMLGVGGRGFGIVFPLVPSYGPSPDLPATQLPDTIERTGWVRATVSVDGEGPRVEAEGQLLRVDSSLRRAIETASAEGPRPLLARATRRGADLVVDRLMEIPTPAWRVPFHWALWGVQIAALVALAVGWVVVVGIPVVEGVRSAIFDL